MLPPNFYVLSPLTKITVRGGDDPLIMFLFLHSVMSFIIS